MPRLLHDTGRLASRVALDMMNEGKGGYRDRDRGWRHSLRYRLDTARRTCFAGRYGGQLDRGPPRGPFRLR
jgi:hypothetical protein